MSKEKPTQADLFGVTQKGEQARRTIIEKNRAEKAAGVQPVQEPLSMDSVEADKM